MLGSFLVMVWGLLRHGLLFQCYSSGFPSPSRISMMARWRSNDSDWFGEKRFHSARQCLSLRMVIS